MESFEGERYVMSLCKQYGYSDIRTAFVCMLFEQALEDLKSNPSSNVVSKSGLRPKQCVKTDDSTSWYFGTHKVITRHVDIPEGYDSDGDDPSPGWPDDVDIYGNCIREEVSMVERWVTISRPQS